MQIKSNNHHISLHYDTNFLPKLSNSPRNFSLIKTHYPPQKKEENNIVEKVYISLCVRTFTVSFPRSLNFCPSSYEFCSFFFRRLRTSNVVVAPEIYPLE